MDSDLGLYVIYPVRGKKIFTFIHLESSDELERFYKLDIMVWSTFGLLLEYLEFSLKQLVSGLSDKLKIAQLIAANMTEQNSWWLTLFSGLSIEERISLSRHQIAFFVFLVRSLAFQNRGCQVI